jgi:alpha-L-rhamnosidase
LTFHGFRYLELSGLPEDVEPDLDWVTGVVLHNDMPQTGAFTSSDATLNRLQKNIEWGQRGNFLAVPTDCPQRDERLGWTGDAQVFCATANFNFNALAFYVKWCADMRDSQNPSGSIPFFVPNFPDSTDRSSTAWGDAAVIVPWEVYQSFGYKRILEDNYDMMREWIRHYDDHEETEDFIHRGFTFGDWLQPYSRNEGNFGETENALIGTAYYARSVDLTARTAEILGKEEDAQELREKFTQIAAAFQQAFFDAEGKMTTKWETQTGYLLALGFDLVDNSLREKILQHLVHHIQEEAGGHLRTGFVGTPLIAPVLAANGHKDFAYELLFKTTYPGWFYSIEQGATTMWERWNSYSKAEGFGNAGMNSFNHYAYGAIGEWMYESVAGLQAVEPGYKRIRFSPQPGPQLDHAEATLETPYGTASSAWKRVDGRIQYTITVPPNTTGEFVVGEGVPEILQPGSYSFTVE